MLYMADASSSTFEEDLAAITKVGVGVFLKKEDWSKGGLFFTVVELTIFGRWYLLLYLLLYLYTINSWVMTENKEVAAHHY